MLANKLMDSEKEKGYWSQPKLESAVWACYIFLWYYNLNVS